MVGKHLMMALYVTRNSFVIIRCTTINISLPVNDGTAQFLSYIKRSVALNKMVPGYFL